jgi:anti-sigma regulatory factor (Ser/Thr protein kinase)/anti-anti-sigma regulatory factor
VIQMQVTGSMTEGCVVLTLTGLLDHHSAPEVRHRVAKALVDGVRAVVCDLGDLEVGPTGSSLFLVLADLALDWPETPLVLCAPSRELAAQLRMRRVDGRLPVRTSLKAALADPGRRARLAQATLRLPPRPEAPGRARRFLARTCARWHAERFEEAGSLVLSELVTNAVLHAGTGMQVRVVLNDRGMRLSVRDGGAGWPRPATKGRTAGSGLGLPIVATLAEAWGTVPAESGGKVVWCRLPDPGYASRSAQLQRDRGGF